MSVAALDKIVETALRPCRHLGVELVSSYFTHTPKGTVLIYLLVRLDSTSERQLQLRATERVRMDVFISCRIHAIQVEGISVESGVI